MTTGRAPNATGDHDRPRSRLWPPILLPNEPRIVDHDAQARLTDQYLQPALPELERSLLAVRQQLDPELRQRQPEKYGKPYPLGQCLEIALAVQQRLSTVHEADLPAEARPGLGALRAFLRAGGTLRQVWGDLRGQYFQNAFQVGTLYIDVANDTVVPTKPKVEILPFAQAQFIPIRDFHHFSQIARSYWQDEVFPNHVLPTLAPHCPLIHIGPTGMIRVHGASQYMLTLTRSKAFQPSESVLRDQPMPQTLFDRVRDALKTSGHTLATTPEQGRQQALQYCREYRNKRWHRLPGVLTIVTREVGQLNQHLTQTHHHLTQEQLMPTIKIDNIDYDLDSLSTEIKAQLQHLQLVDQEIARLNTLLGAMQTARNVYFNNLKAALTSSHHKNGFA